MSKYGNYSAEALETKGRLHGSGLSLVHANEPRRLVGYITLLRANFERKKGVLSHAIQLRRLHGDFIYFILGPLKWTANSK